MHSLLLYVVRDVLRSRFVIGYAVFVLLAVEALIRLSGVDRVLPALISVVVQLVPLVSIMFAAVYVRQALPTAEMLLTQPVSRRSVFSAFYFGLAVPLALIPAVCMGVPMLLRAGSQSAEVAILMAHAALLSATFVGIGCWAAIRRPDAVRGFALALFVWLLLAVFYDGVVLLGTRAFADYPLEGPLMIAMIVNPIDLTRVSLFAMSELSTLLGYSGAVFLRFLGGPAGVLTVGAALIVWVALPAFASWRRFLRHDF